MAAGCFFLQLVEGNRVAFETTNAEITLAEIQKDVLMLFEKRYFSELGLACLGKRDLCETRFSAVPGSKRR